MNKVLWQELDEISERVSAGFDVSLPIETTVTFVRAFRDFKAGTKAIVLEKQGEYYALAVKGQYVEGVHKTYLNLKRNS